MRNGLVWRRQLGRHLRLMREDARMTLDYAAPRLYWSVSKLSRIENGQQSVDVHGVKSMLDLYNAADQWDEIVGLTQDTRQRGWWRAFGLGDDSYVGFESGACLVREFALACLPGLLQIPDYSRALFEAGERDERALANALEVRAIRQRRLTSAEDPLELATVIDESLLHRPIGGRAVLGEQLRHLAQVAELPSVTIQVLPVEVGAHAATASGFTVLSFGDLGEPDIAYFEHALGSLNIEKEKDVARARVVFDRLTEQALGPADSVALIQEVATRY